MIDFFTGPRYTEDELMARLKFFIGVILGLTLFGIVFVVLYSLIFVTQPMNGMSPVDNKFFELIIPIATFLVGTLSGIMLAGGDKKQLILQTKHPHHLRQHHHHLVVRVLDSMHRLILDRGLMHQ